MNRKKDEKTAKILYEVMDSVKALSRELQEKRDKSLWKEIKMPYNLGDIIHGLKKSEMTHIRQNLGIKYLSSLNKDDLASELTKLLPIFFEYTIRKFDRSLFDLITSIVHNSGAIPCADMKLSDVEKLMRYGIAFPGKLDNQKVLFMPEELINQYNLLNIIEIERVIQRNTEWILLAQGMLYYYGVMDAWRLIKNVEKYVDQKVNIDEFIDVLSFSCYFYEYMDMTDYGYRDSRVHDSRAIIAEHNKRHDVDYYPFTKKYLLKTGNRNNRSLSPEMKSFTDFLLLNYDIPKDGIYEISDQLINIINMGLNPSVIIEYLETWIEIPSFEYLQILTTKVTELYNNTRQWALKGHTPGELFKVSSPPNNVIEMPTQNKIGRNDPCPCGSGKKYKKCCGK